MTKVAPTQVQHPWRATARTAFAALVGLAALAPILVDAAGLGAAELAWLTVPLAVCAAVTRMLALPQVNAWLDAYLPWLKAAPVEVPQADSIEDA